MSSSVFLAFELYATTRAEPVGRQKSRAVDPRETEADKVKRWREHVDHVDLGEEGRNTIELDASRPAGSPREVQPACGLGPEPRDQAYEACSERQVSPAALSLHPPTNNFPATWRRQHALLGTFVAVASPHRSTDICASDTTITNHSIVSSD